jgi:peptidoglycan hydrolase-like protein with peptidoglycan-binding domain
MVVPSHVHVIGLSSFPILVEAFPRYRGDSFFVVRDDIVIVDHSHRIVDVVPAGPNARLGHASGSTAAVIDLSETEIREVQQVLLDRGYYHGPINGVFGPEMREALISFQRKEGFESTGRIDNRTVSALGLSDRIGQNGQGKRNQSANQSSGANQSLNQPATTNNSADKQPSAANNSAEKQPSSGGPTSQNNQNSPTPSTTGQDNNKGQPSPTTPQGDSAQKRSPSEK